jgi:hypothetical protein
MKAPLLLYVSTPLSALFYLASSLVFSQVWLVNPILGMFLHPLGNPFFFFFPFVCVVLSSTFVSVGAWSDKCQSALGRRRPFLLLFHIGSMIGLALTAYGADLIHYLTGTFPVSPDKKFLSSLFPFG